MQSCKHFGTLQNNFKNVDISLNHYVIRTYADYIKKKASFECNNKQRNVLLNGIFELFELDDMVEGNAISNLKFIASITTHNYCKLK